jgi:hypothetical protein
LKPLHRHPITTMTTITTLPELEALFGAVGEASLRKEVPFIHPRYRDWIQASPFVVLATQGPGGLDASPRGDPAPVAWVRDEHTVLLPERRGNNRIDSLRNIVTNPQVALLFFVPGVRETLRINGQACIRTDADLLARFEQQGTRPHCVIEVAVQTVFFQCARALLRAAMWSPDQVAQRPDVPTPGQMLAALSEGAVGGLAYDDELPGRLAKTLY